MKPHKHAEVIHAFADGAKLQVRLCGAEHWQETRFPDFADECEYRIKPEPAAPKWPQTTMEYEELETAYSRVGGINSWDSAAARALANAAIAHACEAGEVVPADKVREIEAKARAEGKREGLHPVAVIQAACNHMRLGDIDADTIQIILLKAAQL